MFLQAVRVRSAWMVACLYAGALCLSACHPSAPPGWSGYAEGEYVYVAAPIAGRLSELAVQRGDTVPTGALLYRLDAETEQAAQAQAQAQLVAAQAQASNTQSGRRSDELAVTQAQLAQARTQLVLAQANLQRQRQLIDQGFVSPARLDEAQTAVDQGLARTQELQAALRVAHLPARRDEQTAAQAQVAAASAGLQGSRWRAEQSQQQALAGGQVADTYYRVGEWVAAGQPVVALLPPGHVKARFFVPEAQVAQLAIGQAVRLQCDGCGAPIAARISFIATQAEYTPPVIYSNAQRAKLVFMVEARPAAQDAARLRPGLPLDVLPGSGS